MDARSSVIDRDCGVAAFVRIDPDDHHGLVSLRRVVARTGRSACAMSFAMSLGPV